METLPPEMIMEVCQYLTLRDLASCSAVSHRWREVFNEDRLWRPHCDASMIEPLEKTPSVVEPTFVTPEVATSTLSPISRWHLAYLREHHFWNNWRKANFKIEDIVIAGEIGRDFLSNTLLVRWFPNKIQIWDVSTVPVSLFATTYVYELCFCIVYKTNRLLVKQKNSVKIMHVDPLKGCDIEVVHDISVESHHPSSHKHRSRNGIDPMNCVNGSIYICVNDGRLSFDVIDLERGVRIKTESPFEGEDNRNPKIVGIKSSPNSDHVIVFIKFMWGIICKVCCHIYSLEQLIFISRPITWPHIIDNPDYFAIAGDYLAISAVRYMIILNFVTLKCELSGSEGEYSPPLVFNNSFVCQISKDSNKKYIGVFSLTNKTWTIFSHGLSGRRVTLEIVNNKYIQIHDVDNNLCIVLEPSGETFKPSDKAAFCCTNINESFTRGISSRLKSKRVYYFW